MNENRLGYAKLEMERGNLDHAHQILNELLNADPNSADVLFHIGSCHLRRGMPGLAVNVIERAAQKMGEDHPLIGRVLNDLGVGMRNLNRVSDAEPILRLAAEKERDPRHKARMLGNLAGCFINNGTPEKALEIYTQALELEPDNLDLIYNSGLAHLEMGNWAEGFWRYDKGFESGYRNYKLYDGVKPWVTGADFTDKTVIVWGDQGLGDEIMGSSCIPDLMRDCKRVIFDCHPRLVPLFERSFGIECHGTRKTNNREWHYDSGADYSIPLTSLYTLYRSKGEFPGTPYLKANVAPRSQLAKRIGLSWAGGTTGTRSDLRSMELELFAPIMRDHPEWDWYSLQYHEASAQDCAKFEEKTGIHIKHFPGQVQNEDYDRTAAFVGGLDMVISVCTSVVHLAGALGVETKCLVPSRPAWRYLTQGDRMPWYGSVKLYRQTGEDWQPAFASLRSDLRCWK